MTKKLSTSDFRAVRHKLEPHEFAISEGQDVEPTNLIEEETWAGIMHRVHSGNHVTGSGGKRGARSARLPTVRQ